MFIEKNDWIMDYSFLHDKYYYSLLRCRLRICAVHLFINTSIYIGECLKLDAHPNVSFKENTNALVCIIVENSQLIQ